MDGATIIFNVSNLATINGRRLHFISETGVAVFKQAPYSYNFQLRLFMPRVKVFSEGSMIKVATTGFGENWQGAPNPPHGIASFPFKDMAGDIQKARQIAEEAQCQDYVLEQMKMQADLFKAKSDLFAPYGICPPARDPVKLLVRSEKVWPGIIAFDNNLAFSVQMSSEYAKKFGYIFAVPVKDAETLPLGGWVVEDARKVSHKNVKDAPEMDLHPTNVVNGYYVDWEIYSWDASILKENNHG